MHHFADILPAACLSDCSQLHDGFTDAYYYVREATLKCVKGHMDHFAQLRAAKLNGNATAANNSSVSKPMVRTLAVDSHSNYALSAAFGRTHLV
jgi:hypothetical protein